MNYSDPTRPTASPTDDEGLLFAPVPAWERGKKRRGLRGLNAPKRVAETRSFETPDTITTGATTYRDGRTATTTTSTLAAEDTAFAAPIGRTATTSTRKTKSGGVPGAAVAAGIVALAAIGGAGWYMSQDNDTSFAELTPGVTETTTSTTALATAPMAPPVVAESRPTQMAAAEPARASTVTTRRVTTARTRPATAFSATEQGINASGTAALPAGPQPYSTLQGTTPAPTPPVTEAPVAATPPVSAEPVPVNPPASEAAPTPTEEPTAPDPT